MKKSILLSLLVVLLFGIKGTYASAASFPDVGTTHRAEEEIQFLATGKVVTGDSFGKFNPDRLVTRAEAAAMIGRSLSLNGSQLNTIFSDVDKSNFASGYIQNAVNKKIISGYGDGTFKPYKAVTRGEMALLISRAFEFNASTVTSASDELMNRGIAQGMQGGFGGNLSIKRADFSVFLARAINAGLRVEGRTLIFPKKQYVNTYQLNFREGPSTDYAVKGAIYRGAKVEVAYDFGDWSYIRTSDSVEGFVNSSYLSDTQIGPIVTPPPTPPAPPTDKEVVVLDPGHGYQDPGAHGFGYEEKNINLDTSLRAKKYFEKTPIDIRLTRESDTFLSLSERVNFAKNVKADLFISVHSNAAEASGHGTETYYYNSAAINPHFDESRALATYVQARMITAMNLTDRGVKHGDFHVIRENTMPAILVELGYITNQSDIAKLGSASYREAAGKAIFLGTLDYMYNYEHKNVVSYYNVVGGKPSAKLY